jgi:hypothetical protein
VPDATPQTPEVPPELQELLNLAPEVDEPVGTVTIKGYDWPVYAWENRDTLLWEMFVAQTFGTDTEGTLVKWATDDGLALAVRPAWLVLRKGGPGMTPKLRAEHTYLLTEAQAEQVVIGWATDDFGGNIVAAAAHLLAESNSPVKLLGTLTEAATKRNPTRSGGRKSAKKRGGSRKSAAKEPTGPPSSPSSSSEDGAAPSSGA